MRTRNNKLEQKKIRLIQHFQSSRMVSIKEIMDLLDCNRISVYNYIQRLRDDGYALDSQNIDNQVFYSLNPNKQIADVGYTPLTLNTLREYSLIRELQKGPIKKQSFRKHFTIYRHGETCDANNRVPLDIKLTQFHSILNQLLEQGTILYNQATNSYYLSEQEIPVILSLNDDELDNMYYELSTITPSSPYYAHLSSVYNKIGLFYGNINEKSPYYSHYLTYGKKMDAFSSISPQMTILTNSNYKKNILHITYTTKEKFKVTAHFSTGLIVYCVEKDKFYLLGIIHNRILNNPENSYGIIDIANILEISDTTQENIHYNSQEFNEIYQTMFSISTEEPTPVTVVFENTGNIERKIRYLTSQRYNSNYTIEKDQIIYTDIISGLPDFAKYLRQFGRSVQVIEPLRLKEMMAQSVKLSLQRYTEEINNE